MIDLHSHSHASDGQLAPAELVRLAHQQGVTSLALTDHDTVAGIAEARSAAMELGIELVPGIEVSATSDKREVHILGHFVDPENARLAAFGDRMRGERIDRMEQMLRKLDQLGVRLTMQQVQPFSGGYNLGRPHLARALVAYGHCHSVREAFDRFLGNGKPAHVEHRDLSARDAIALIHEAGGTASIAHPLSSRLSFADLERLAQDGLDAVEVDHPDHREGDRGKLVKLTYGLGLVPTGGSDYHGPAVTPDRYLGDGRTKPKDFEQLRARARERRASIG